MTLLRLLLLSGLAFAGPAHAEFPLAPPMFGADPSPKRGVKLTATDSGFVAVWGSGWIAPPTLGGTILSPDLGFRAAFGAPRLGPLTYTLHPPPGGTASLSEMTLVASECGSKAAVRSVCLTRFDSTGELGDVILVDEDAHAPSVVSNGSEALFVFIDGTMPPFKAVVVTISPEGTLGAPIVLGPWSQFSHAPAVAASGGSFFVSWSDGGFKIAEIRHGAVVRVKSLEDAAAAGQSIHHIDLGGSDEGVLVLAYVDGLRARMLDGDAPWSSVAPNADPIKRAVAVPVPGGFVIAWVELVGTQNLGLYARRFAAGGSAGLVHQVAEGLSAHSSFDLASAGTNVVVAFTSPSGPGPIAAEGWDVRARSLDPTGAPLTPSQIVSLGPAPQLLPAAVWDGTGFLTVWNERDADGFWRVRARKIGPAGEALSDFLPVPFRTADQLRPAVGFNGESYFIVWSEGDAGLSEVRGARVALDGRVLDESGIPLFGAGALPIRALYAPRTADVEWNGTEWMVTSSSEDHAIVLRRVAASSVLLDPEPITLTSFGFNRGPLLSCGDETCLVAWRTYIQWGCQFTCPTAADSVIAARVSREGHLLDDLDEQSSAFEGRRLTGIWEGPSRARGHDVAWNERKRSWLVVWPGPAGAEIEADGSVYEPAETPGSWSEAASVISSGDGWSVGWHQRPWSALAGGWSPIALLLTGWTDGTFEGPRAVQDVQWMTTTPPQETDIILVQAPRPLGLLTVIDRKNGQPRIVGEFLEDVRPMRQRAVRR